MKQSQPPLSLRGGVADVAIWEVWTNPPRHTDCFASACGGWSRNDTFDSLAIAFKPLCEKVNALI